MSTARASLRHLLALGGLLLAAAALELSLGYYRPIPFALMLAAAVALAIVAATGPGPVISPMDRRYPLLLGTFGLLYGLTPMSPTAPQRLMLLVPVILVVAAIFPHRGRYSFWAMLAVILLSGAGHIMETSGIRSDVNTFFAAALHQLLRGATVYAPVAMPVGSPIPLVYPPGALLLVSPSILLTGDSRWALLAGELVACIALRALLPRTAGRVDPWREALVLIPLALPRVGEYFFEAANHDWLVLGLVALALVALTRRREVVAAVVLGLAFSTKQTALVYPGAFLLRFVRPRWAVLAVAVALATVVPFLVQDLHATASALLDPSTHGAGDYPFRLHLYGLLYSAGLRPGRAALAALQLVGLGAGGLFWLRSRGSVPGSLSASGAAWILLVILSPFAGYNYYAYGIALVAWGLALESPAGAAPGVSPPWRYALRRLTRRARSTWRSAW